jgi:hypothetical protein
MPPRTFSYGSNNESALSSVRLKDASGIASARKASCGQQIPTSKNQAVQVLRRFDALALLLRRLFLDRGLLNHFPGSLLRRVYRPSSERTLILVAFGE